MKRVIGGDAARDTETRDEPPSHAVVQRTVTDEAEQDVFTAMTHALAEDDYVRRVVGTSRIDSRTVVLACIDFADSIGRIPSISELCLVAHVSERRLRKAFSDEFDVPPSRFFRDWALEEAHRLRHNDSGGVTVTHVAVSLGFDHLGRFAGHYKNIFGENPSVTLRHDVCAN